MVRQNKRLIGIVGIVLLLLLMPAVAMQFTNEVNWTVSDFSIMGVLLLGTGLLGEFVLRKVERLEYRIVICVALVTAFLLVWLELAVGVFGTPFAGS